MTNVKFALEGLLKIITEPDVAGVIVTAKYGNFSVTAKGDKMSYKLPSNMKVGVTIKYVDKEGNPASVDGDVAWSSSDDSTVTVTVDTTDSTLATIEAVGPVALAQVTATADADLGEGTRELVTMLDVEVVAGEAVAGTIEPVGSPEPA